MEDDVSEHVASPFWAQQGKAWAWRGKLGLLVGSQGLGMEREVRASHW